ncbi:MAG: TIGR02300 family protein [Alphaproteobacteria bacterium]|nr:TIGR02300 family protein [Alphaproteobacteria bacterium]
MASKFGIKRTCMTCGEHFFDLNKNPYKCPKCGKEMAPEDVWKARGVAIRARKKEADDLDISMLLETPGVDDAETDSLDVLEDTSELGGADEDLKQYYGKGDAPSDEDDE